MERSIVDKEDVNVVMSERGQGGAARKYSSIAAWAVDDVGPYPMEPVVGEGELVEQVEALVIAVDEGERLPYGGQPPAELVYIDAPIVSRP